MQLMDRYLSAHADHFPSSRERVVLFFRASVSPSLALPTRTFVLPPRKWGPKDIPAPSQKSGGPWPPGPSMPPPLDDMVLRIFGDINFDDLNWSYNELVLGRVKTA